MTTITLSIDQTPEGSFQLSINTEDEDGGGHGYRIHGPKYDGQSKTIIRHILTKRDAEEIKRYLVHVR